MEKKTQKAIKCYKDISKLYLGDCLEVMPKLKTDSIDAVITDPPYGLKFMNNKWDASVPSVDIWKECLRVLKPGAFAFVMSSSRQDVLSRMICNISDAGFDTNFSSIYWTYASGFPKAQNLSKTVDKRAGMPSLAKAFSVAGCGERKDLQTSKRILKYRADYGYTHELKTEQAKALDGAYAGFQPKPAVEVVIVAMKPLEEKTYVDQAIKNGHGCTWMDDCRIPYKSNKDKNYRKNDVSYRIDNNIPPTKSNINNGVGAFVNSNEKGRFPPNVLCEDDALDDGIKRKSGGRTFKDKQREKSNFNAGGVHYTEISPNTGSFSRYFSLDAWFEKYIHKLPQEVQKTFPFMITPKPSKVEKERNLDISQEPSNRPTGIAYNEHSGIHSKKERNIHPTIKPLKLMMWLIVLGTQEGDIILDPFMGSGTTPIAAKATHRIYKGIELEREFYDIAIKRIDEMQQTIDCFL